MLVRRGERLRDDPETAGRTGSDNYRWLREKSIVEFRESAIEGFVEKLVSSASMRAVCFEGTQKKRERERERENFVAKSYYPECSQISNPSGPRL